jgi:hypothetical protein
VTDMTGNLSLSMYYGMEFIYFFYAGE